MFIQEVFDIQRKIALIVWMAIALSGGIC